MNDIFEHFELTLSDLRRLGKQGGATAMTESGETVQLLPLHGTVPRQGYVEGKLQTVKVVVSYSTLYDQIRTIKRDGVLIARRVKNGKKTVLRSTGKGYHRLES